MSYSLVLKVINGYRERNLCVLMALRPQSEWKTFFWAILSEIAARDHMTTNQLITKLYLEAMDADHDLGNFTSFLRVCAGRYLSLIADDEIARDDQTELSSVDAPALLKREAERDQRRSKHMNSESINLRYSNNSSEQTAKALN